MRRRFWNRKYRPFTSGSRPKRFNSNRFDVRLAGRKLDVRMTPNVIEVFQKGVRIASHCRSHVRGKHTTVPENMPPSHREYLSWTPERFLRWASKTGPFGLRSGTFRQLLGTPHPESVQSGDEDHPHARDAGPSVAAHL